SFGSTRHAVECALDIQKATDDYSKTNPQRKLRIRIGINTGEVVEEAGDIFGAAVNMAARVAGKAKGGQVLVSEVVRQLVGPVAEIHFTYRGHYKLKGFPDRWRLHEATPGEVPSIIAPTVTHGDGFVGRDQEKLDIRLVLDRAATGTGGMVLLAELVPSLRAKVRGTTLGSNTSPDGRPEFLFKAVFDVLVASQGAKPMLIVLDDLQWADEATVLLVRDLAERLGNSKIVVLGTYWESDLDPERPFTGVVARLLRRRRAQRIA